MKIVYSLTNTIGDPEDYTTLNEAKKAYFKNPKNYWDDICMVYDEEACDIIKYISLES